MKKKLKKIKNILAIYFGIGAIFRYINRKKAIILTYHLLIPEEKNSTRQVCSINEEEFNKHLKWMSRHYKFVKLSEIVNCLEKGIEYPKRCIAVTFDDGYANFLHAYTILKKMRIPVTVFISSSLISSEEMFWYDLVEYIINNNKKSQVVVYLSGEKVILDSYNREENIEKIVNILKSMPNKEKDKEIFKIKNILMDNDKINIEKDYKALKWKDIDELCKDPLINIGSHTKNHVILSRLTEKQIKDELEGSKLEIERNITCDVEFFSYPNGQPDDYNSLAKEMILNAGYKCACTTIEEFNDISEDLYELKRFGASLNLSELIPKISGFDNFLLKIFSIIGMVNKIKC